MARLKSPPTILPYIEDSRFRALVEKSSDVIMLMSRRGKILYATPSIVRLYGRTYEEFMGFSTFTFLHPLDVPRVMKQLTHLLLHPQKPVTVECRVKHKNGSWKWVEATGTNFLNDPQIKAVVVNFHDITERKVTEERKDEFISIASHELRSPLTSLKNYLQLLQRKYLGKDEKLEETLSKMDRQIIKITSLIDTLLDVTRIQQGKIKLQKSNASLSSVIQSVIEDMQISTHRISVHTLSKKQLIIDESRIAQVVENIISNALKYSPEGSLITIWNTQKDGYISTHIKDRGEGIAKENVEKIFQRFFQENRTPEHQGLGLGLYISSILIKLHGGSMFVDSGEGKGSTFTFSLPLKSEK